MPARADRSPWVLVRIIIIVVRVIIIPAMVVVVMMVMIVMVVPPVIMMVVMVVNLCLADPVDGLTGGRFVEGILKRADVHLWPEEVRQMQDRSACLA